MRHILFGDNVDSVAVAILIKDSAFSKAKMLNYYIDPLKGIDPKYFIGFDLSYQANNKCNAAHKKDYISVLLPEIDKLGIKNLLVADAEYFKTLTNNTKADSLYGYIVPCAIEGYEHMNVILSTNYGAIKHNPAMQSKLDYSMKTLFNHIKGNYADPGTDIIHSAKYPKSIGEIKLALQELHQYPELACDIETRSLEFWNAGIETIAFSWDKHNGLAFAVDKDTEKRLGIKIRRALKQFFIDYKGKCVWHNISYDAKVIVHELWMNNLQDYRGMIDGIKVMTKNFDDTKLIAYLATNNAVKNELGLKILAAEFAGNYAQSDIKDTTKISLPDLLEYNIRDCLATIFVKEKFEPIMIADDQLSIYETIFKPSVRTLLQTELCGMPIIPEKVQEVKTTLTALVKGYHKIITNSWIISEFHLEQQEKKCKEFTEKAKKKVFEMDDPRVTGYVFNPNSGTQLQILLYAHLQLPVLDLTATKSPATGGKTLKKLLHHTTDPEIIEILNSLIGLSNADKILTSFIPAFENAQQLPDGSWRLYGNFNLGGTVTGRISSSSPNLTNLPSHSVFAKPIKECFACISGWLFVGDDADSLEDKISALTTKDKNKLKVYLDGFDGHALRAYTYWPDQMLDIENTVESINTIEHKYPKLRQDSKPITFLKTYGGTYHGLMKNLGFSKANALIIDERYHQLYTESDEWVRSRINQARTDGYVTGAFGLRLRTHILKTSTSYISEAEGRTAGNMLGQSYCMLTLRAFNEFMLRVWASPYKYDVLPMCTIHDSIYLTVKDNVHIIHWVNENLVECMAWQDLPELHHDKVKLSSTMEIYHPHWGNAIKIPNNASKSKIQLVCHKAKQKYNKENTNE